MPTLTLFLTVAIFGYLLAQRMLAGSAARTAFGPPASTEELPDILESMSLCTEAGMDVMNGMAQIVEPRKAEPLAGEIYHVVQEVKAGATKADAWRRFADRMQSDDVRMLVSALLQAETLGVGPTRLLAGQAEAIRERRFRMAERHAGEAPVKLLLPMVCIFLSVFIALFGAIFLSFQGGL